MGKIRNGEDAHFPYDSVDCWYILIKSKKGKLEYDYYTGGIGNKIALYGDLEKLLVENVSVLVFGVWHGNWRTDAFLLNPKKLVRNLRKATK